MWVYRKSISKIFPSTPSPSTRRRTRMFRSERGLLRSSTRPSIGSSKSTSPSKWFAKKITLDLSSNGKELLNIQREIKAHSAVRHRNVIEFFCYEVRENKVFLILELAENGNLFNYLRKLERPLKTEQVREMY